MTHFLKSQGHGITLETNPDLLRYVIDQRIPIESCITSNIQTSSVKDLESHPFRRYFDAGVNIVPCTDNTSVSNTDINKEYSILQDHFGFKVSEIVELIDNGIKSAFIGSTHRGVLRSEFLKDSYRVLKEDGHDGILFFPLWFINIQIN